MVCLKAQIHHVCVRDIHLSLDIHPDRLAKHRRRIFACIIVLNVLLDYTFIPMFMQTGVSRSLWGLNGSQTPDLVHVCHGDVSKTTVIRNRNLERSGLPPHTTHMTSERLQVLACCKSLCQRQYRHLCVPLVGPHTRRPPFQCNVCSLGRTRCPARCPVHRPRASCLLLGYMFGRSRGVACGAVHVCAAVTHIGCW